MHYDKDYQNEQALSATFQAHLKNVSEIILGHFKEFSLIEVGCGKGYFLELLQMLSFRVTGLDPAYEGTNPAVIREYFSPKTGIRADGIILRHVLEHVPDPVGFLSMIRDANGGSGKIYIEVPCFDWICEHRAWFDIFYEHVNYFRLCDFHGMFGLVFEAGHSFNGQYLYIVADLATIRIPECTKESRPALPDDFLSAVDLYAAELGRGRKDFAIWGGASKGVLFALFMQRAGARVNMVVDINPAKQGKFLAGTGLQVLSPSEAACKLPFGANIFVMNSNYLDEVRDLTANQFNYRLVEHECV
jgi:SAM-dependent methyltransferase